MMIFLDIKNVLFYYCLDDDFTISGIETCLLFVKGKKLCIGFNWKFLFINTIWHLWIYFHRIETDKKNFETICSVLFTCSISDHPNIEPDGTVADNRWNVFHQYWFYIILLCCSAKSLWHHLKCAIYIYIYR